MKVIPNWLRQNYKGAVIIENYGTGFALQKLSHAEFEIEKAETGFSQTLPTYNNTDESVISFERLIAKLELLHNNGDLKDQLIIVGKNSDPFLPILDKLESSIELLDALCHYRGQHCVIQTRSPHVILAVPLLRNNASYITVSLGIETLSDLTARTLTPSLPSPTDRCVAARTLTSLGLNCEIILFPISTRPQTKEDIQQLHLRLSKICSALYLVEAAELASEMTAIERNYLEESVHPLYDWQMAKLLKQHFEANEVQNFLVADENAKQAA